MHAWTPSIDRRAARLLIAALVVFAWFLPSGAAAHKASDSYLQIAQDAVDGGTLRWDIALRDLDLPIDLDENADGALSWGEVRRRLPEIEAYALAHLSLNRGDCALALAATGVEKRIDGAYLALAGRYRCTAEGLQSLDYRLFGDVDPTHRGLLRMTGTDGRSANLALDPGGGPVLLPATSAGSTQGFFREGLHHILIGFDHLLFLLCLLLPAVLRRVPTGWQPVEHVSQAVWPVLKTVTMFTVAHSITLALAALEILALPGRIIEPAIALTIVAAAADNIRPLWHGPRHLLVFAFGLVHGFGFAGALSALELPATDFALALLQFNLGVEAGQLLAVCIACAALYALRRLPGYAGALMPRASMLAIALAATWFVERVFDLRLIS